MNEKVKAVKTILKYCNNEVKIEKTKIKKDFILYPEEQISQRILVSKNIEFIVVFISKSLNLYLLNYLKSILAFLIFLKFFIREKIFRK